MVWLGGNTTLREARDERQLMLHVVVIVEYLVSSHPDVYTWHWRHAMRFGFLDL